MSSKTGALGTYLTDGSGRSVYEFASDTATKSTCSSTCLTYWPALTSSSPATAGSGVTADIGSITQSDGSKQVTYKGHPLYYFALDKAAGDTKGQGLDDFGAKWWLLEPERLDHQVEREFKRLLIPRSGRRASGGVRAVVRRTSHRHLDRTGWPVPGHSRSPVAWPRNW